jgi:hypothetical protein
MRTRTLLAAAAGVGAIIAAMFWAQADAQSAPLQFFDAHSHLVDGITADAQVAGFRKGGVAHVILMDPTIDTLKALTKAGPGYVVPFHSIARTPEMKGTRLDASSAAMMVKELKAGDICGFGEIPTRIEPRTPGVNDAAALLEPARVAVYDAANANKAAVNLHVDIANADVAASIDQIAKARPNMKLVLAHAGWSAAPDVIDKLLTAHANIFTDVSIRLDMPTASPNSISFLTADGAIKPEWLAVITKHPDRFLFALDVSNVARQDKIAELLAIATKALAPLPRATQEQIAHGNTERLLGGCGAK